MADKANDTEIDRELSGILEKLEQDYGLQLLGEPVALSGGFLHRMYALYTTGGDYALKLLNPHVMKRGTAPANYAAAERLEKVLEERGIPILPSLSFGGTKLQRIGGQYFYLFDFYEGKALAGKEITAYHCREMGAVLAAIHGIDRKTSDTAPAKTRIDWDFYLREMRREDREIYDLLRVHYDLILESQEAGNRAREKLPFVSAICHNDMDPKNVLWRGRDYRIIDLECLSYNHPMLELFELALCWSGYEECDLDFSLMRAFLEGYRDAGGALPDDWPTLYDCNNGRLEWLEYNLKRVLGIDCGERERDLGRGQVIETLRHVVFYHDVREQVIRTCAALT